MIITQLWTRGIDGREKARYYAGKINPKNLGKNQWTMELNLRGCYPLEYDYGLEAWECALELCDVPAMWRTHVGWVTSNNFPY